MLQNIACRGALLFCVLFSRLHLCASQVTWSPPVAAGDGHFVAETSGEAQRCHNSLPDTGRVLLQKSSSRIQLKTAQPKEGKSEPSFEHASSIAPVKSSRALGAVVDEGQQKSEEKTRASVHIGENQVRTRFLVQSLVVGLVLVSIVVLSSVCLIVLCMKRPQEETTEEHENFDPCLSPRQVDGRNVYKAPRTPARLDTSRLPPAPANSLMSLPQVPTARCPIGRILSSHSTLPQGQSVESQHPMLLLSPPQSGGVIYQDSITNVWTPPQAGVVMYESQRYSTATNTQLFSAPPTSTSPRMRGPSSSTLATEQQVAMWRAEIQARVAAATDAEVARRKWPGNLQSATDAAIARGRLPGGDGRVGAAIARSSSPPNWLVPVSSSLNGLDARMVVIEKSKLNAIDFHRHRMGLMPEGSSSKLPMRARTTSPQGHSEIVENGVQDGLASFLNTPRHGANIFDAACDAFQDL